MEGESRGPSLEDCLKLLRGERDEQRLAGLLLATKVCNKDDYDSIRKVYDAVGIRFLDRLLRTGMGVVGGTNGSENQDAYLQLSLTILATFCRFPEIASSRDMVSKIPLILEVLSKELNSSCIDECYELLFLVSNASEDGAATLFESGGMRVLASQMPTLPDGSRSLEISIRIVQLMTNRLPSEIIYNNSPLDLAMMVTAVAKQFAVLQNALKFEALHLLSAILSSSNSAPLHAALGSMKDGSWYTSIRVGVMAILQNRVVPAEKHQALVLADSTISIVGEEWFIGKMDSTHVAVPADRCLMLVLESSRIEIAVLLNEIAYLKYEASKNSSSLSESLLSKQQNVAVAFSLVERIIKLISKIGADEGSTVLSESTFTKVISGLNETIGVVLDYLQDAKDHGITEGDDLLACVRVAASYLAEAPVASREKVEHLLEYMLSVKGENEPSPFHSVCFMLPMLCQITMELDGCKVLASSGAYKAVVECLIKLIGPDGGMANDNGPTFLACDTVLNLLLKREDIQVQLDDTCFLRLLGALAYWTGGTDDISIIMMGSSICALIFDSTSEDALLQHPSFDNSNLITLFRLIVRSLAACGQEIMCDDAKAEADLHQIVISGYSRWADRFPHIKEVVER